MLVDLESSSTKVSGVMKKKRETVSPPNHSPKDYCLGVISKYNG